MSTVLSPVPATKPGRRAAATARPVAVTRVLVVEDHPLLRTVIKVACEQAASLEVVADMEDAESALEACRQVAPDVIVLDLSLAGQMQGLELARAIRAEGLPIRILVLTARTDDEAVFESVTIGVDGYLEKTAGVRMIAEALERVARGERVFTSAQMRGAISELGKRARYAREASGAKASLSERELEVLQRAALGLTVGQVARRLGISPRTVETHLTNAYRKLGARNRVQALSRASELGLVELA
jgi:DNA-binding NarL/FixJ family response regulator